MRGACCLKRFPASSHVLTRNMIKSQSDACERNRRQLPALAPHPPLSDVACQRQGDSAEQKTGRLAALADWLASVAALGSKVSVQP